MTSRSRRVFMWIGAEGPHRSDIQCHGNNDPSGSHGKSLFRRAALLLEESNHRRAKTGSWTAHTDPFDNRGKFRLPGCHHLPHRCYRIDHHRLHYHRQRRRRSPGTLDRLNSAPGKPRRPQLVRRCNRLIYLRQRQVAQLILQRGGQSTMKSLLRPRSLVQRPQRPGTPRKPQLVQRCNRLICLR